MWANSPGRSVPYRLQQACFRRDDWTCRGCGYEGQPNDGTLHADHIVNRAEGGHDTLQNLQTLCTACHLTKTLTEQKSGRNRWKRKPQRHPGLIA